MYKIQWINYPQDLEGMRLEILLNGMLTQGYEFVDLKHFEDAGQVAVIFKGVSTGRSQRMENASLRF